MVTRAQHKAELERGYQRAKAKKKPSPKEELERAYQRARGEPSGGPPAVSTPVAVKGELGVTERKEMQEGQIAKLGATPLMRETTQGDKFDVRKPIVLSDFSSLESFKEALSYRKLLTPETPEEGKVLWKRHKRH